MATQQHSHATEGGKNLPTAHREGDEVCLLLKKKGRRKTAETGSDSDVSEDVALAEMAQGVSALSGLITSGAEDQSVEPLVTSK